MSVRPGSALATLAQSPCGSAAMSDATASDLVRQRASTSDQLAGLVQRRLRSDGLFGLPELGLSLVGSLQGRSAIHSCNSTVGHAWRGLNSLLWLALSWGLLGLVIYTTTDPLNS